MKFDIFQNTSVDPFSASWSNQQQISISGVFMLHLISILEIQSRVSYPQPITKQNKL